MQKAEEGYALMRQQAHYSDFSQLDKIIIAQFEAPNLPFDVYFFYGAYQR